jgi:hypothetical protein
MFVNEYVTKFTQLSHYAPHEVDTDEKKREYFLNGLNDGLAYSLEARDFENFQGVVNKALVLENHTSVMEHKRKLVHQHQPGSSSRPRVTTPSAGPVFHPAQSLFQSKLQVAGQGYSTPQRQVMPHPNNSQTPTAGNQSVQRTQAAQNPLQGERRCYLVGRKVTLPTNAPNSATALLKQPCPPLQLPVELILFPLLLDRTMFVERSITLQWRKPRKLQTWSLVHFSSTTLLQLCCLILEHRILSYLLHMLRSIIFP